MARDYEELVEASLQDVVEDFNMATPRVTPTLSYLLNAIDHKQAREHRQVIRRLTWAITVLTVVNVVLVGYTVLM